MFSNPSNVTSTRSLAPLFQIRQTSFGHILETKGTGEEKYTTGKKRRAKQNTQAQEIKILTFIIRGQGWQDGDHHIELDLAPTLAI